MIGDARQTFHEELLMLVSEYDVRISPDSEILYATSDIYSRIFLLIDVYLSKIPFQSIFRILRFGILQSINPSSPFSCQMVIVLVF